MIAYLQFRYVLCLVIQKCFRLQPSKVAVTAFREMWTECLFRLFRYFYIRSIGDANHMCYLSFVGVDRSGIGAKNQFIISWYLHVYAYMSACSVLFMAEKREALRPSASWSNWHVNHFSVGGILVRVYLCACVLVERSMTYLKRQHVTAGALSSLPSCSDAPMARHWSFSQLKTDRQPGIWALAYYMDLNPNKTLQHVCGN